MTTSNPSETFNEPMPLVHKAGTWFIVTAIAFIVLGTMAIFAPFVAGLAVTTIVGWLLLVGGVMHIVNAFRSGSVSRAVWQSLVGLFYLFVGVYFLTHPLIALTSLTLLLAFVLFFEAIMEVTAWWATRHVEGSGWLIVNALASTVLGVLIWMNWPSATVWVIGTLVGIKLMISGFSRLMLGTSARRFEKRLV
ncbi:MAG TPA: DUF308 domain-containing protein [Vicinamibacterales bacterium]|nr:DUF308 domain-containing protein [Vicinamibacterales bacterium]